MSRLFWTALGAAAGVYAVRRLSKAAQAYTPTGVAHGLSDFGEGVREGMEQREGELRLALGIDTDTVDDVAGRPRLDADSARALLDDPTGPGAHRAR